MKYSDPVLPVILDEQATALGDKVFLYNDDRDTTYAELAETSRKMAQALAAKGVGPGDRVGLALENRSEWVVAFFGLLRLGAIAVTINALYRESELMHILGSTRTKVVIGEPASGDYDLVDFYATADLPHLEHRVFLTGEPLPARGDIQSYDDLLASGSSGGVDLAEYSVASDDTAVILFTSGTTGPAKGAVLTHRSVYASAAAQNDTFDVTADDVVLGVMPISHVGGVTCTIVCVLIAGGSVEQMPRFNPVTVKERYLKGRVTIAGGVPTMYSMILSDPDIRAADLSKVRICIIGGSNVEPATATAAMELFSNARLANLYGLTETSGASIISPPDEGMEDLLTTIGVAIGDFETRIVDPVGDVLPAGHDGELQIRGACVMSGYWELPEKSAEAITPDGWLNTGDIAVRSEDGHISLRGRSKEMFIRGGYNVYPTEIENVIAQMEEVAMVAVVGMPDDKYGSTGRAFIVLKEGQSLEADDVLATCTSQLAKYKVPDAVEFVPSLPLTSSGKIKKTELGV